MPKRDTAAQQAGEGEVTPTDDLIDEKDSGAGRSTRSDASLKKSPGESRDDADTSTENDSGEPRIAADEQNTEPLGIEQQQALDQWLRRIPDDPGGLLRRKFARQYQRRGDQQRAGTAQW
jgi:Ca-activated chloride channel family protein